MSEYKSVSYRKEVRTVNGQVLSFTQLQISVRAKKLVLVLRSLAEEGVAAGRLTARDEPQAATRVIHPRNGLVWLVVPRLSGGLFINDWKRLWDDDLVTIAERVAGEWRELDADAWERLTRP